MMTSARLALIEPRGVIGNDRFLTALAEPGGVVAIGSYSAL
jgi:hypothetical protein